MSDHASVDPSATASAAQRPRLVLKPRDEDAARKAEIERQQKSHKSNPFGEAKPREAILAQRTGKTEEEILREAVKAERAKLNLNPQQLEEKTAAEEAIKEVQEQLENEDEASRKLLLEEELKRREDALNELWQGFEKLYLDAAAKGEVVRPSERRQLTNKLDSDNARDTYKPRSSHHGFSSNLSYSNTPGYNNSPNDERRSQPGWSGSRTRKPGFSDVYEKDVSRQSDHSGYRSNNFNTSNTYRSNRTYDNNGRSKQSYNGSGENRSSRGYMHSFDDRGRNEEYISRGHYGNNEDFGSAFSGASERQGAVRPARQPHLDAGPPQGMAGTFSSRREDETYKDYPGMGPPIHF